jgi:hypothetical protein
MMRKPRAMATCLAGNASIRTIAAALKVSTTTVQKVLAAAA